LSDAQQQALERVQRSQQHLLSLINDVLNFAKLEAGRVEYNIKSVELAPIVKDVVDTMHVQLEEKGLACSVSVPDGVVVRADGDKVHQIVLNLLSNALKFTERGTIAIDAATAEREQGVSANMVPLRVTDTGIGIPHDKQDAIFDPFVQVHRNLTRSDPGTGLGLAISRDLARGMGGDLCVSSQEGQGSTFTLLLPRA
jgi:signal transduction histidine kinase